MDILFSNYVAIGLAAVLFLVALVFFKFGVVSSVNHFWRAHKKRLHTVEVIGNVREGFLLGVIVRCVGEAEAKTGTVWLTDASSAPRDIGAKFECWGYPEIPQRLFAFRPDLLLSPIGEKLPERSDHSFRFYFCAVICLCLLVGYLVLFFGARFV